MRTVPNATQVEIRRKDQGDLLFEEIDLGLSR